VDNDWGWGVEMIDDFTNRLPKALPDVDQEKIDKFIDWLKRSTLERQQQIDPLGGATMGYLICT